MTDTCTCEGIQSLPVKAFALLAKLSENGVWLNKVECGYVEGVAK